jgi:hypothetical protein
MHPLLNDLKNMSFEELDNRYREAMNRLQKLRSWGKFQGEAHNQLLLIIESLQTEKQERLQAQKPDNENPVVVSTDPLDTDPDQLQKKKMPPKGKQYSIL